MSGEQNPERVRLTRACGFVVSGAGLVMAALSVKLGVEASLDQPYMGYAQEIQDTEELLAGLGVSMGAIACSMGLRLIAHGRDS